MNLDANGDLEGNLRTLSVDLPPGLVGNANVTPKCTMAQVNFINVPGASPCPLDAAVGMATVQLKFAGLPEAFNLAPGSLQP